MEFMTYSLSWMQLKGCLSYITTEKFAKRRCSGKWYVEAFVMNECVSSGVGVAESTWHMCWPPALSPQLVGIELAATLIKEFIWGWEETE